MTWDELKQEVSHCEKCPLHKSRTNAVFGNGNPAAPVFLIGEGPGLEEDRSGTAFVGKSGRLLDSILEACGFTRQEHVFIGNIVKCRPPDNRTPTPEEQVTCLPYLLRQIEIVDPKIIVLLGATALRGLIDPDARITRERGTWRDWNSIPVMPTFHPSALLRNPPLKKDSWNDFRQVVQKYRELVDPDHAGPHV